MRGILFNLCLLTLFPVIKSEKSFAVSNRAPISTALWKNSKSRKAVRNLLSHFNGVDEAQSRGSCVRSREVRFIPREVRIRYPEDAKEISGCFKELIFGSKRSRKLWEAINALQEALDSSSKFIIRTSGVNWNRVYSGPYHNPFSQDQCDIRYIGALKRKGQWMLRMRVTSFPVQAISNPAGQILTEFVLPFGDAVEAPIRRSDGSVMTNATTTLQRGRIKSVCCQERSFRSYLMRHKKWQVYAAQSIQISNIASLALPLVLSLIPTTLFVDTGTKVGSLFSIFSKTLNVLPLCFKGAELINLSRNPPVLARTLTYGLERSSGIGGAATLVLKCTVDSKLTKIGSSFIVISILCMIFGLFLDYRTRKERIVIERECLKRQFRAPVRKCIDCRCALDIETNPSSDAASEET